MQLILVLILTAAVVVVDSKNDELSSARDDPSVYDRPYDAISFKAAVFNGFPDTSVSAFVIFKEDRVSRLRYGQLRSADVSMAPYTDYIIQFRQFPTDVVRSSFTDYGFMDGNLERESDVIIVITRAANDPHKPRHHLLTFDRTKVEADSSKLYIFNGLWSREHHDKKKGLNVYGLYQRYNFDGSQSESITQLASNLLYNSGLETSLEPGTSLNIKGFYGTVRSVSEFKTEPPVVHYHEYVARAGEREYLVTYGDHGNKNLTGHVILIDRSILTATSSSLRTAIINNIIILLLSLLLSIILIN